MGEVEAIQEKIARLTRERDEMATQATACAEEVDRVLVEIGAVQAENQRLKERVEFWLDCAWKNGTERDQLHEALAESERKRVEAEADLADALATRDLLSRANVDRTAVWVENSTPTQETSHVES